jgi:hypothetical protein
MTASPSGTVLKHGFFAIVGAMALFVLWNNERFFLNPPAHREALYRGYVHRWTRGHFDGLRE